MKRLLVLLALTLTACSFVPPLLTRAPMLMTPRMDNTGECTGSEIMLSQAQLYSDHNNRWSLIAEATNMRVDDFEIVLVCITLHNKGGGKPIEEKQYLGASLLSYETVPFRLLLESNLDQVERVTVAAKPIITVPANIEQARITRIRRNFIYSIAQMSGNAFSTQRVAGRLRNNEPQAMVNVRLFIGMYDREGKLVGVAQGQVEDIAPITPGSVVSFTATSNMLLAPVASKRVVIEGEPAR